MNEQFLVKQALHESEGRLRAVLETVVDGIVTIDEFGIIHFFNRAAEKIFGYSAREVIGKNVKILMPEPYHSEHDGYISRYLESGDKRIIGYGREVTGRRKDESVFPLDLAVSDSHAGEAKLFTGILRDISERKKSEAELTNYAKKLEASNRDLEEFAAVASHDLKEPLRKIQIFGGRLKNQLKKEVGGKEFEGINKIIADAQRMQTLIDDLLAYSTVTFATRPASPVDLTKLAREVASDFDMKIEESGAKVEIDELPTIHGDVVQLRLVFRNLLQNAIKYHKQSEPPAVKIYGELLHGNDQEPSTNNHTEGVCRIYFQDNGIGIDKKYQGQIFSIFQRLHNRSEYEGTGIGLALCRKILERLGGDITVESTPGGGSLFVISIPSQPAG